MKFSLRAATAAIAASVALAATAHAQTTFTGFTNACFFVGVGSCTPENVSANVTDVFGPLSYRNSTFSGITSLGFLGIGNVPSATLNVDNLGSFTLTNGLQLFNGESFNLRVNFTAPSGVSPNGPVYTATLLGNVTPLGTDNGGVSINFGPSNTQSFAFDGGTFTLKVNDVTIQGVGAGGVGAGAPDKLVELSGQILATTSSAANIVPEPSTYLLMAAGLAGLGIAARRRRRTV